MPNNKAATKAVVEALGLSPRSQEFVNAWFASWDGNQLPTQAAFPSPQIEALMPLMMTTVVRPGISAEVTFMGEALARASGTNAKGLDWISLARPENRQERMRRMNAMARGAILRTTREVKLDPDTVYFFETVSVPLRPADDGEALVVHFADWNPPRSDAVLVHPTELGRIPEMAEFIAVVGNIVPKPDVPVWPGLKPEERAKIVSRAAIRFLLNMLGDASNIPQDAGLDPLDYIIAIAVGSANVSHVDTDPALSRQYAGQIEPDWMRRGISRAAVSRATNLPLETVRRRINALIEKNILMEREDGIVLSATNRFKIGARRDLMHAHALLVERLVRDVRARGVAFD